MRTKSLALLAAAATAVSLFVAAPADAAPARPTVHVVTAAKAASTIKLKRTSTATPVAADWITLTGTASKALVGAKLTVQRKESGKGWGPVGTTKVSKAGTFSVRTRATGVGGFSYKVSSAKTKKTAAMTSNSVGVTVYKWYYLSELTPPASTGDGYGRDVVMAGTEYFQSVTLHNGNGRTSWVEFNASYKCSAFTAVAGVADNARVGTVAHHTLLADGTQIAQVDAPLGKTTAVGADISGVFRIRLQTSMSTPSSIYVTAGWGDARMLCSGQP